MDRRKRIGIVVVGVLLGLGTASHDAIAQTVAATRPVVVVVEAGALPISADDVRAAITEELHGPAVPLGAVPANEARGLLTVMAGTPGSVVLHYQPTDGPAISRTVAVPQDPSAIRTTVALLAGNMARTEADEVLGTLALSTPPPSAPQVTVSLAFTAPAVVPSAPPAVVPPVPPVPMHPMRSSAPTPDPARDVIRWTSTIGSASMFATALTFQLMADAAHNAAVWRDPTSGLPVTPWGDTTEALDAQQRMYQNLAIGSAVAGGAFAVAAAVAWLWPGASRIETARGSHVSFGVAPGSVQLSGHF